MNSKRRIPWAMEIETYGRTGSAPTSLLGCPSGSLAQSIHEPTRRGRGAVERHTHQPARGTAAAVAADHIAGADGLLPVGELRPSHTVIGLRAVFHLTVPGHLDVVEPVQPNQ